MRVIQSIACTSEAHGGTSRSVTALCNAIDSLGVDVHLITGVPHNSQQKCIFPVNRNSVHTVKESMIGRQFGVPTGFVRHLRHLSSMNKNTNVASTIVHDHGLWLATNHAIARESDRLGLTRVVSPDGMLSHWSMSRRRRLKWLVWHARQRHDLKSATAFHATSEKEAQDIRRLGFQQPIAIIPHGVEIPVGVSSSACRKTKTILFLSRIHPVKGLLNLVNAFHQSKLHAEWELVLAGPDEAGHQVEVENLVVKLGLSQKVLFPGAIDENNKWALFQSASLFVLPSFTENFGICVAEALASGLPVITTKGTPWKLLVDKKMGWWVEPSIPELRAALIDASSKQSHELQQMGHRGTVYAKEELSWNRSATMLIQFFQWLTGEINDIPRFVMT